MPIDLLGKVQAKEFLYAIAPRIRAAIVDSEGQQKPAYQVDKEWTAIMTDLTIQTAESLGCRSVVPEFWPRVDVAAFDEIRDSDWDEWALEIAVELENNWKKWHEECNKLMLISCGLKVLITYYNEDIEHHKKSLNRFEQIYRSRKYNRRNDCWLFIFLPWADTISKERGILSYELNIVDKYGEAEPVLNRNEDIPLLSG